MTGLRFLGMIFLAVLVIGKVFDLSGEVTVAVLFYSGCAGILLVWAAWIMRRHW